MKCPNAGILYPVNPEIEVKTVQCSGKRKDFYIVPHKSWNLCKDELDEIFPEIACLKPDYVFVLAPLHKGKVFPDEEFKIYSYNDCFVNHCLIEKNDDICSEEYSYEILVPYLDAYLPNTAKTAFFAPDYDERLKDFIEYLKKEYTNPVFAVSSNSDCAQMWKQAF